MLKKASLCKSKHSVLAERTNNVHITAKIMILFVRVRPIYDVIREHRY